MGGQSHAAAVFCPTSQILSGGAKSTRERNPLARDLNEQFVHSVQRPHAHLQKLHAMVHFAQLHCRLRRQLLEWWATSRCLLLRDDEQDR
jgi:hypothetical protein